MTLLREHRHLTRVHEVCKKGFRWLQASGTTIGSYKKGIEASAALRPVYPGGSNVFEHVSCHVLPLAQVERRAR